ncbi:MAG: DUF3782 domain-containing protein [Methylococcales bacterium]|nr:DUF3782 domain-containing protein [Methylococcales bacterium]
MTDDELKDLVASLAISQRETDRQICKLQAAQQETDRQLKETDRQLKKTDHQLRETDHQLKETDRQLRRQLKELGKQIGSLGEKFGGFTEGMAFPSMSKILTEQFGMEVITPRVKVKKGGEQMELDVLAYANSERNTAVVVEVKSHLRSQGITQLKNILTNFRKFLPEHGDKKLYGMLAVVDAPEDVRQEALAEGFYLAGIHDDQFVIETPKDFTPKNW